MTRLDQKHTTKLAKTTDLKLKCAALPVTILAASNAGLWAYKGKKVERAGLQLSQSADSQLIYALVVMK